MYISDVHSMQLHLHGLTIDETDNTGTDPQFLTQMMEVNEEIYDMEPSNQRLKEIRNLNNSTFRIQGFSGWRILPHACGDIPDLHRYCRLYSISIPDLKLPHSYIKAMFMHDFNVLCKGHFVNS